MKYPIILVLAMVLVAGCTGSRTSEVHATQEAVDSCFLEHQGEPYDETLEHCKEEVCSTDMHCFEEVEEMSANYK